MVRVCMGSLVWRRFALWSGVKSCCVQLCTYMYMYRTIEVWISSISFHNCIETAQPKPKQHTPRSKRGFAASGPLPTRGVGEAERTGLIHPPDGQQS
jgi:hypothetical protein